MVFTKYMEDHLNLGLKFAILPLKLDITQVLTDFQAFERSMLWTIFLLIKKKLKILSNPYSKHRKVTFLKKHKTSTGLSKFLGAVKSEITDLRNRN